MSAPRLLLARRMPAAVTERARREFDAYVAPADLDRAATVELANQLQTPALLIGGKSGLQAADIARLPACVRIIANASAGFDHLDVTAARGRGIIVTNVPDAPTECTADLTLLLMLAASRRASEYEQLMRQGWRKPVGFTDLLGHSVHGRRLGIVGLGRIGQAVARRARAFGMKIIYHNRRRLDEAREQGAVFEPDLHRMLPQCEILSLHVPGGTGFLMGAREFALLPPRAMFVNTARGALVDEDALIAALQSGHIYAAGLDVFRKEPDFDLRFAELPNVFLTPHVGTATVETRDRMGFDALDNIAAVLAGEAAINPV